LWSVGSSWINNICIIILFRFERFKFRCPFGFEVVVDKFIDSKSSRDSGAGCGGLYGTGLATTLYLNSKSFQQFC